MKPVTQVSSRGGRYAFNISVLNMWVTSEMIVDQMRAPSNASSTSQPNGTLVVM